MMNICVDLNEFNARNDYPNFVDFEATKEDCIAMWLSDRNLWRGTDWVKSGIILKNGHADDANIFNYNIRLRFKKPEDAVIAKLAHT